MKGVILAGGSGTRLWPITKSISKQLIPVYNKPMIYYPLCTLMQAGIQEILIITVPQEESLIKQLLGDGKDWGISIEYATQSRPEGIAQAFLIGEKFIGQSPSALILGDNLFFGETLSYQLEMATKFQEGATIFVHKVATPESYGVIELGSSGEPISIVEKPSNPRSNLAVTGLYFYDSSVIDIVRELKPSARGELEITDVNNRYLSAKKLRVELLGRGMAWLDTGNPSDLLEASNFVKAIETRQGMMVGCPEEIAYDNRWIDQAQLSELAIKLIKTEYGQYLRGLAETGR